MSQNLKSPLGWAAITFLCDQVTKLFGENFLSSRVIIPHLLEFTPFRNPGFFFGFWRFKYLKIITVALSCLVLFITIDFWKKNQKKNGFLAAGIGLIWGGMLGNLADRLFLGSVFDFILLWRIPTFNLADTALTIGASFIIAHILFCEKDSK